MVNSVESDHSTPRCAPPKVVAEIGCNHKGEMSIAEELIRRAASFCQADAVKFQKRCVKELLSPEQYHAPHPVPENSYGESYGQHREFLEFDLEQHRQLQGICADAGIEYSCSVWDRSSAEEIASLKPKWIKIPSACNTHFEMLKWLAQNYGGQIHVSLGMTRRDEEEAVLQLFRQQRRLEDVVLYSCTSGYPVPAKDVCLLEIQRLKQAYASEVAAIGFSGHHLGIAIDIAALTLGASWVERHYTLDRNWKGTDHSASLEPDALRSLCHDLREVSLALCHKEQEILDIENPQRDKLKWRSEGQNKESAA